MFDLISRALPRSIFPKSDSVAVVRVSGVIGGGGRFNQGVSLASLAPALEKAFAMKSARAVALIINSPGGSPVQSMLIYKRIRALAEENSKPVFAFCEDAAASGGYFIACAADEIFADASSIVGSIGVISAGFGFQGLLEKVGVERRVHTAGKSKAMLDPFSEEKASDVEHLKRIQGQLHETFAGVVRTSRGNRLNSEREEDLFSGSFWAGEEAHTLGLIDGVDDLRSVMRKRYGKKIKLKPVSAGGGRFMRKDPGVEAFGPKMMTALVDTLEERGLWSRLGL